MPSATDFKTIQAQAVLFTPGLQFRAGLALAHLLTRHGERFDGEPFSAELPPATPPEIPRLILKSQDSRLRLQAGPARLDLVLMGEDLEANASLGDWLGWATGLFVEYLQAVHGRAGRLACLMTRVAPDENPAYAIAEHFCKPQWLHGPLNRPSDFEVHAGKQFRLGGAFMVNSWFRCKSAELIEDQSQAAGRRKAALVEQDFNTLLDVAETRELSPEEIGHFFRLVLPEFYKVLQLYFPDEGEAGNG